MEKLAIFDVDFTITKKETMLQFYKFMIRKNPLTILYMPWFGLSFLLYFLKIYDLKKVKENFLILIDGIDEYKMKKLVKEFYDKKLSKIFYNDAMETIKRLKREGCKIYLISASPEFYLNELYNIKEIDMIIGTRISYAKGIYSRRFQGENNKGEEKVKRLMQVLKDKGIEADFESSYMFSDSLSDLPLFKLVGNPYLINYRGHGHEKYKKIKILKWK